MNTLNAFFQPKAVPLVLGHRGVPKLHQENSLASLRKAVELGIDGVEFDVFKTKDDRLVVFHDEETERLTGIKGNITEMTWDEISKLRIQRTIDGKVFPSEERIPLLEEILDEFKGKLMMNIEMKAYTPKWSRRHTGTKVAEAIRRTGAENSVIVTSFDFFMLYYLEKRYAGLHSGFAYDDDMTKGISDWFAKVPEIKSEFSKAPGNQNDITFLNFILESNKIGKLIGSTVVDAEYSLIDTDTAEKFHKYGMLIGSYTLYPEDTRFTRSTQESQEEILQRLIQAKVDWIETDDPERLQKQLHN
ncbi:glycerophosphodiester phosphodiesterase family protein [Desulfobulbus sp. TB]|nr:glycerophosphodiester phosphodiesterase family protein [Desulfobulbus sp. TB]